MFNDLNTDLRGDFIALRLHPLKHLRELLIIFSRHLLQKFSSHSGHR